MTVDQQFTLLYEKLQQLLLQQARLQRENKKLQEELAQARKTEAATKDRIDELQQQVSILKLAAGEMSEEDKKVFERKLNQYIKEIDKAIAYLSE
ncbi:MAG TPA: hypothetical protein VGE06_11695 [Flavisolibacter sp.]